MTTALTTDSPKTVDNYCQSLSIFSFFDSASHLVI